MANLERETEEALGLPPRTSPASKAIKKYNELEASEKTEQPLNYNKPIVSYNKTNNSSASGEQKESLNVGPFTYNSGRNSLTGNAFVEKRSTPNTTYPDGAVVNTQGKTVGLAINGRLLLNKEGDNSLTAGFNKVKNKSNTNIQFPDGETQQLSDGVTVKGYDLGATLGRFIFDARKDTSTKGKDRYSGKVTYLLGDNADISIQDSTEGDPTLAFNFRKSFNHGGLASEHQDSQMEDMMGYPAARDPSIIDPTTGQPYDDSSRRRQQAEITRQADVKEKFQPVELPKLLEERIEKAVTKEVSTDDLGTAYDEYRSAGRNLDSSGNVVGTLDSFGMVRGAKEPLNLSDGETLRPVLRTDNFKSPIDKIVELNYLLTDPSIRDKTKRIVSGLDENTEFGENAIQGFYDSVAKGQGLSATENAWCAAFVHYILTELGADTITSDGGYDAQRARKYVNYGSPVENFKDAKEGDIVIWDWPRNELGEVDYVNGKQDGVGDHVSFYAGTRITDQDNPNMISVVGGNQGNKVTLMTRPKKYVLGIRKITKNDINVSLSKDLAKNNPIFKQFVPKSTPVEDMKLMQTPPLANTQQTSPFSIIPSSYNEGGMAMNDQMVGAFEKGALILDLNKNNTNKNNTVKNYDPLEALTQEYNILREKEIKRIESGNLQKHDSGSVEDMDEYAYERQILDWLKSKSKDQPIGGYDANANSSIFSDLPSFWKAPHDHEHSTLDGLVDPNKYKSKFDTYREFFRKVPEEYLNNHPNSENLKFMQKVFKEMDRQEPMVARGGLIEMNDQTQRAFALGGEAETVDPVSGNDVPPGSLPEEVRDDIDAKLSEGEYVVPADVVRFFGVKFFEDLRTEAKMGLQQMDADGRIGGEPVQEQPQAQEDSMDVAELKAALSESGMYAGGLTDGGSLDTFIDDASRSPMVNGRMRASGATVKMAVGGLAIGNYGDVTKVDGIIQKLMTAANKDPALMEKLASKGIMVNKTGADKKSAEMQQANKPQEPIEAAEGTLVDSKLSPAASNPFDFGGYDTLGGALFKAGGIENPQETLEKTFFNKGGKLEQIVLIGPNGEEIPVAWNTAMPIPEGYTRKATNAYGVQAAASSAATVSPVAISTQDTRPRQTGDDSRVGPEPDPTSDGGTSFKGFDYDKATLSELQEHVATTRKYAQAGTIAGVIGGPIGMLIGVAAKVNHAVVVRRAENELKKRVEEKAAAAGTVDGKAATLSARTLIGGEFTQEKLEDLLDDLHIRDNLTDKKKKLGQAVVGSIADLIFDPIADRMDKNAADAIQEKIDADNSIDPTNFQLSVSGSKAQEGLSTVQQSLLAKTQQQAATDRKEEKDRKEREAAQAAAERAQVAANLRSAGYTPAPRKSGGDDNGGGGGSSSNVVTVGTPTTPSGRKMSTTAASNLSTARSKNEAAGGYTGGGKYGGFESGGLVSAPAAKQKKKQTTQRRKGLGTRP